MAQSDRALVSPMPIHLPFPVPSLFALVVGMVLAWGLLLLLGFALRDTAMGKRLLRVVPTSLIASSILLLLLVIHTGAPLILSVTLRDLLIGVVWGAAFDVLLLPWLWLMFPGQDEDSVSPLKRSCKPTDWFSLLSHGQDEDLEPRSPLFGQTVVRHTTSRRWARRPTKKTQAYSRPTPARSPKKSLPKRKQRLSWPKNR